MLKCHKHELSYLRGFVSFIVPNVFGHRVKNSQIVPGCQKQFEV